MAKNDFRVTSIFKIIIRIRRKDFEFLSLYPQDVFSFSLFFYLNEEELIQQVCLIKYIENKIYNSTSDKSKNKRQEQKHDPTSKSSFLKLLINCH